MVSTFFEIINMKDICTYEQLISIKPVEDNTAGIKYLSNIIQNLLKVADGGLYVYYCRPNYSVPSLIVRLKGMLKESNIPFIADDFELSFVCNATLLSSGFVNLLSTIWFAFEQSSICFLSEKAINDNGLKRKAWNEITSMMKSYVMFRGMEENVLWIGKSMDLEFNEQILNDDTP